MKKYKVELLLADKTIIFVEVSAKDHKVAEWIAAAKHPFSQPISVEVLESL
jgi:hypothetical protein